MRTNKATGKGAIQSSGRVNAAAIRRQGVAENGRAPSTACRCGSPCANAGAPTTHAAAVRPNAEELDALRAAEAGAKYKPFRLTVASWSGQPLVAVPFFASGPGIHELVNSLTRAMQRYADQTQQAAVSGQEVTGLDLLLATEDAAEAEHRRALLGRLLRFVERNPTSSLAGILATLTARPARRGGKAVHA